MTVLVDPITTATPYNLLVYPIVNQGSSTLSGSFNWTPTATGTYFVKILILDPEGDDTPYAFVIHVHQQDAIPIPPYQPGGGGNSLVVGSYDPNDKLAPAGYGDSAFVRAEGVLAYTVMFENESTATAPAQSISVTDVLDPNLDLDTFSLSEITFAGLRIQVPDGLANYSTSMPIIVNGVSLQVEVMASLDRSSRTLTLTLKSVDPNTGWSPEDPLIGLLYPEDTTGRGQGSISYSVRPLMGLPSGTVIRNQAKIIFDYNDPIDTPLVHNTLDLGSPDSHVTTPSGTINSDSVTLAWDGADDANGAGVASYDLFVSIDGGDWFRYIVGTTATTTTFAVAPGHAYGFYTIATDNVGRSELAPTTADTVLMVEDHPPVLDPIGNHTIDEATTLLLTATASDPDAEQTLRFSLDAGAPAGAAIDPITGVFTWTPSEADGPGTFSITIRVTDNAVPAGSDSETITVTVNEVDQSPTLSLIANQSVNEGESLTVSVTASDADLPRQSLTYSLVDAPTGAIIDPMSGVLTWTPDYTQGGTTYTFRVRVTDPYAASNETTVTVTVVEVPLNHAPTEITPHTATVVEKATVGTIVANLATIDPDQGDTHTFTLNDDAGGRFRIVGNQLQVAGTIDYRITPTLTVQVTATDAGGLTITDTIVITVQALPNTAPVLTVPDNQSAQAGQQIGPLAVIVADVETPTSQLLLNATCDNPALIPTSGIILGGSGSARTLTLHPASGAVGTAVVTLTLTDADGLSVSNAFALTVTAPPVNTPPTIQPVAAQTIVTGQSLPPVVITIGDVETPASALQVSATSSNPSLVPASGLTLNGSGATRSLNITPANSVTGTTELTITVTDADGLTASISFTLTVHPTPPSPTLVGYREFAVGSGGPGAVTLYNSDQSVRLSSDPFDGFSGGVRTAAADFNGDGIADLVVGTGPGRPTRVMVFDGATQTLLFQTDPFEAAFTGGVFVTAGDLTGDGRPELVISPDEGGGPRIRVFDGNGFGQLADFFGIEDTAFRGGARAAVGDITGDGVGDLIVAAGFGGGPRVAVFYGTSLVDGAFTRKPTHDFFAYEIALRNGVYVAAGDLNGDGKAELMTAAGPGGGPRVSAFSGADLLQGNQTRITDFFAGDTNNRGGVRLSVKNLDNDNLADLVVGSGTGAGNRVTGYLGRAVVGNAAPESAFAFDAIPGFNGGIFVG